MKKSIVLNKIKSIIKQIDPQAEVILYGSRARGDERPDSDWDLLILVNTKADLDYERIFRHKLFDLELELEQSFSVTVHNKNEWKLKHWVNTTLSKYCQRRNKDIDVKRATQEDYIKYRLERAWKTLEDAKYLASINKLGLIH